MSSVPTVWPAAPSEVYFKMGGWSPGGVVLATALAVFTSNILGFIGRCLTIV